MIKITFTPHFARQLKKLELDVQEYAFEKVDLFKDPANHEKLKVHKLQGTFAGSFSFSVSYRIRIIFDYTTATEVILLAIGDHDIYK